MAPLPGEFTPTGGAAVTLAAGDDLTEAGSFCPAGNCVDVLDSYEATEDGVFSDGGPHVNMVVGDTTASAGVFCPGAGLGAGAGAGSGSGSAPVTPCRRLRRTSVVVEEEERRTTSTTPDLRRMQNAAESATAGNATPAYSGLAAKIALTFNS